MMQSYPHQISANNPSIPTLALSLEYNKYINLINGVMGLAKRRRHLKPKGGCSGTFANASCIPSERKALLKFRGEDCCTWKGVVCSRTSGYVVKLDLRNQFHLDELDILYFDDYSGNYSSAFLKGDINPSLLDLKHLEFLDLSMNDFSSSSGIPGILLLALLQLSMLLKIPGQLDLSGAKLPKDNSWLHSLNMLPSLLELHLSRCQLPSIPQFLKVNFTSLELIDLSQNGFGSPIPRWLFNFSNIQHLDLSKNAFNGSIPSEISSCKFLEVLDLHENNLEGEIQNTLTNLCSPSGCIHNSLKMLNLGSNTLTGYFPVQLAQFKHIEYLNLESNSFQGPIPVNSLSGPIPEAIGHMWPKLHKLHLSGNQLNGSIPLSICKMKDLDTLDLSENQLSGRLPRCWGQLTSLEVIDLSNNNLSGRIPTSLGSVEFLASLHLQRNSFEGKLPASLTKPKYLKTLDLGKNAFTGSIPSWIGEKFSLELLSIHSNEFDGEVPLELCHLSQLRVLNLARNRIVGTLPRCFSNFSAMIGEALAREPWLYAGAYDENALVG
ncbi:unnamed protein product [Dovyalis caffra]|uniref:Leucine-rich repeat-containing N-terminal plant-type domain-containing protein n=1 Tax=Dovyalis caffra TaxID=77055 RepID=A0AAV1R2S5_9ROSI|nr:unnamed protein product [Dovyalis caffra]